MKKTIHLLIAVILCLLLPSCGGGDVSVSESASEVKEEFSVKDGKYYSSDHESYVEITEGKYFQLVNWDEDVLENLRKFYAEQGYSTFASQKADGLSADQLKEFKERCKTSDQIKKELVENRAEFKVNRVDDEIAQMAIEDTGTDTEITYKLTDYELWFPFNYCYINDDYKLVSKQFGMEFYLEEE